MNLEYGNADVERALIEARSADEVEAALEQVRALQFTFSDPAIYGRRLFASALDKIVADLPRRLRLADAPLAGGTGNAVIVATEIFGIGGHSKVARDIATLLGDDPPILVLTDALNRRKHRRLLAEVNNPSGWNRRAQLVLGADRQIDKIIELYNLITALRPSRIFLLTHHMDVVAPVALWPFRDVVEFLHHADHLPALGTTLPFARHVDLTYRCHLACQSKGLSPVYAGLEAVAPIPSVAPSAPRGGGEVRIATCGSPLKYQGGSKHRWMDFATAALADPRVEIIHIGPADDGLRGEVTSALQAATIDPARYRFIGPVASLPAALLEQRADIYLDSYPTGGGKANIEAMAAGFRPIVPVDADAPDLLRFDMPAGSWIEVETPGDLPAAIARVLDRSPEEAEADRALLIAETGRFRRYVARSPDARSSS